MLKLYRLAGEAKEYWETWEEEPGQHVVHWGRLGTKGESDLITADSPRDAEQGVEEELERMMAAGFAPIAPEDHAVLLVEYRVDGMGSPDDLAKRHALEERLDETLGWTGLGACDGGSIGNGAMEVCCLVVDFDLARSTIEQDLAETDFADFSRIYRQDAE